MSYFKTILTKVDQTKLKNLLKLFYERDKVQASILNSYNKKFNGSLPQFLRKTFSHDPIENKLFKTLKNLDSENSPASDDFAANDDMVKLPQSDRDLLKSSKRAYARLKSNLEFKKIDMQKVILQKNCLG